jgi:uncharacterized protein (DUF302 family)
MSPYQHIDVEAPAQEVVSALRAGLRSRGITEYAVVDHGHDMAAAGVTPHAAWTLVFGNPAAGEALLAEELAAAVDIPLRLAVIATAPTRSTIVLRPMDSLIGDAHPDLAARFTALLRSLAEAARTSVDRGRA